MTYTDHVAPMRADIEECITEHLTGAGLMDRRQGDRRALVMAEGHIVECARCSDEFDKTDTTQTDFTAPGSSRADVTWYLCERCMRMLRLWIYEGAFVRVLPERPVTTTPSHPSLDGPGAMAVSGGAPKVRDGEARSFGDPAGRLSMSATINRMSAVTA